MLSNFYCTKDEDVQPFLRERAVIYERKHKARTYLIVNSEELEAGTLQILAYFSVALKVIQIADTVTRSKAKKLDGLYSNIEQTPGYLIGQLAKNDVYASQIKGNEVLDYAFDVIDKAFSAVGGRFVLVECADNVKLKSFYDNYGFQHLQQPDELVQLVRFL